MRIVPLLQGFRNCEISRQMEKLNRTRSNELKDDAASVEGERSRSAEDIRSKTDEG